MPAKAKIETTTVTGYFNGTAHRLNLNSHALGINVFLEKGQFLVDANGHHINDPRLEAFVGERGFSREIGDPVPILRLTPGLGTPGSGVTVSPPQPSPVPIRPTVSANRQLQRTPVSVTISDRPQGGGVVPPRPALPGPAGAPVSPGFSGGPPRRPGVTPTGISPSVRAMSVKEAEEAGIIARAHRPVEGLEVKDGNFSAAGAPYADDRPKPVRPSGPPSRPQGPQVRISTPVGRITPPAPAPALPAPEETFLPDPNVGEEAPGQDVTLTDAMQESAPEVAQPSPVPNPARPFICLADGKDFSHYSILSRYARRHFPDRVAEILAPYKDSPHR